MKITAEPRSDQWNADDFIGGPRTFTIAGVREGRAEQKYDIELEEGEGRVWRPPLTMLRVLIEAWGDEAKDWIGRRVTLYRDEKVRFGPDQVGGIRISHLSHLPGGKPFTARVTLTRGRKGPYTVQPLTDAPQQPAQAPAFTPAMVAASTDIDQLREWQQQEPRAHDAIEARIKQLAAAATEQDGPNLLDAADEGDGQ